MTWGLALEGEATVEGPQVGKLIGLDDVRATLVTLRTADGPGIELDKFHYPDAIRFGAVEAPVNTLGWRRVMFAVDGIDAIVARQQARGAADRADAVRGVVPTGVYSRAGGIIVALAEQPGSASPRAPPSAG